MASLGQLDKDICCKFLLNVSQNKQFMNVNKLDLFTIRLARLCHL